MDSTAGWALFAQIAPRLFLAELASEQDGLGQQCGVESSLSENFIGGKQKVQEERQRERCNFFFMNEGLLFLMLNIVATALPISSLHFQSSQNLFYENFSF